MAVYSTEFAFHSKNDNEKKIAEIILETLIKNGAYISGIDDEGETPLHIAAERDNLIAAKLLIENGCKIQTQYYSMHTPLDYAKSSAMIKNNYNSPNIRKLRHLWMFHDFGPIGYNGRYSRLQHTAQVLDRGEITLLYEDRKHCDPEPG